MLEGAHHPAGLHLVRVQAEQLLALVADRAAVRAQEAGDQVEHGGLARAVRADQPGDEARGHVERAVLHGLDAAEGLGHALHGEDGSRHRAARARQAAERVRARPRMPSGRTNMNRMRSAAVEDLAHRRRHRVRDREELERLGHGEEDQGAHERPGQPLRPAQDHERGDEDGLVQREAGRVDVGDVVRVEAAGERAQRGGDGGDDDLHRAPRSCPVAWAAISSSRTARSMRPNAEPVSRWQIA